MANYNIVIGSKFRPFSYAEMLAPVAQSTEAHQKVEEGYANLSAQADMIAGLAAMEPNSEAARRYKAYSDSLYEKADRLAKNGLTPQDRADMLSMYSRYAKEIKPIGDAIAARQQDIARQDTLYDKGNGKIRFDRDARDVSIDEYLDGKRPKYTSLNLDSIRQEVAANAQAWSKRYFSTSEGRRFNGDYLTLTQEQGINPERARAILLGTGNYPELQKLIDSEKGIVNYDNFSASTQGEVDNAITQGINMGLFYDRKETVHDNWRSKLAVQDYYHAQAQKRAHNYAMAEANAGQGDWGGVLGDTLPIHFTEGVSDNLKSRMADQTAIVIEAQAKKGNKEAIRIKNEWAKKGGMAAAKSYWIKNGIDLGKGKGKDSDTLYYIIGNNIRTNVTKDEGLINIWRSAYSSASSTNGFLGFNPGTDEYDYSNLSTSRKKNWGDFDKRAREAYTVNAVGFRDDRSSLNDYLDKTFTQISANRDSFKMYDIKSLNSDGTYTYSSTPTKRKDLPKKTSNGKEVIDYDRIYRAQLSNGDFMLYWVDNKGNQVQKVVKRSDLPLEAQRNWSKRTQGYDAIMQDYAAGIITADTAEELLRRTGDNTLANDYYLLQNVKVEDQKLQ